MDVSPVSAFSNSPLRTTYRIRRSRPPLPDAMTRVPFFSASHLLPISHPITCPIPSTTHRHQTPCPNSPSPARVISEPVRKGVFC